MLYASGDSAGSEHSTTGGWFALLVNAPPHVPPMLPMARYAPLPDVLTGLSRRTVVRNHAHSHHHSLQSVKACRPWAAPREVVWMDTQERKMVCVAACKAGGRRRGCRLKP